MDTYIFWYTFCVYNNVKLNIFSDLRKPGLVPGESLSLAQNYVFCFRETLFYIMANRMRNLHIQLQLFDDNQVDIYLLPLNLVSSEAWITTLW